MGHFASLLMTPEVSALAITKGAGRFLLSREGKELSRLLVGLEGKRPPTPPVAALSFEGTLLPCDVDGWADEWARSVTPFDWLSGDLHAPGSPWTWRMVRACAASLSSTCRSEHNLDGLRLWLKIPQGPPFFYIAGANPVERNEIVLPVLRGLLGASKGSGHRILVIENAGHMMEDDAPEEIRRLVAKLCSCRGRPRRRA